ncbi:MAG: hypothetical protein Q7R99_03310 [bacterium]|nr:hypothetical protein [bacterium]
MDFLFEVLRFLTHHWKLAISLTTFCCVVGSIPHKAEREAEKEGKLRAMGKKEMAILLAKIFPIVYVFWILFFNFAD